MNQRYIPRRFVLSGSFEKWKKCRRTFRLYTIWNKCFVFCFVQQLASKHWDHNKAIQNVGFTLLFFMAYFFLFVNFKYVQKGVVCDGFFVIIVVQENFCRQICNRFNAISKNIVCTNFMHKLGLNFSN